MKSALLSNLKERWKDGTFGEIFTDWKWIFSYSKRFKGPIILYTLLGLLSSTLGLVASIAGKFLVDVVIGHKADQLWLAALVMAGSALSSLAISNATGRIRQKLDVVSDLISPVSPALAIHTGPGLLGAIVQYAD